MTDTPKSIHTTVLLHETVEGLKLHDGAVVVDGTFGGGGHTALILSSFPKAKVIAFDNDASVWSRFESKFPTESKRVTFVNDNFRNIDGVLKSQGIGSVDGVILDIGLSSDQLENSGRGFSFMKDEPLLMTMKENPSSDDVTAYDVVNSWSEETLADIIFGYGEDKQARRIAKFIVDERMQRPIKTTFDLVRVIENAIPAKFRRGKIHYATKTFQAIRIAVNDELGALQSGLENGFMVLKPGGRMSVISFHSLEDRVVKKFYKDIEKKELGEIVNKKVITGSESEIKHNSRARSAKLRIIEKK